MKRSIAVLISALFLVSSPLFAARVDHRQKRQQQRIVQGVQSGQLTAHETAVLETKEAKLQAEKHEMREDGKLTPAEKAKLNRQQNRLSRDIYLQKHDAQTQH